MDKFIFLINEEIVKGENVLIISNYNSAKSDKIYFSNASIDLKKKKFIGKDVNLKIHKNIFDDPENDPRLKGVSAKGGDELTIVNKGIFTSCKETDSCPPWSIKADKITHDKKNKPSEIFKVVLSSLLILNIISEEKIVIKTKKNGKLIIFCSCKSSSVKE